jgi:putative intracellular protease/amidase
MPFLFYPAAHYALCAVHVCAELTTQFYNAKKPVSAVCHGPAALIKAKTQQGDSILKGRKVTGFANSEEAQTPYNDFEKILP